MKSSNNKAEVSLALILLADSYYVGVEIRYSYQKTIRQVFLSVVPLQFHSSKTLFGLCASVSPQLILQYTPLNSVNDPFSSQVKHSSAHKTFPCLRKEFNNEEKKIIFRGLVCLLCFLVWKSQLNKKGTVGT